MNKLKHTILSILNPRTIAMYPDTLKNETVLNMRGEVVTTGDFNTALAELKDLGYVKGFADSFGDLTYTITDAGRAACVASGI